MLGYNRHYFNTMTFEMSLFRTTQKEEEKLLKKLRSINHLVLYDRLINDNKK